MSAIEKLNRDNLVELRKRLKGRAEEARNAGLIGLFEDLTAAQLELKKVINILYGETE